MQHQEGNIVTNGSMCLYYQSWHPNNAPRGILAIVHGLGGHSGLYGNIVHQLIPKDFAIYSVDLRGHGKSSGQRGYINSWDEYRDDVSNFLKFIASQNPEIPIFLLGHSLGGLIVLDYVLHSAGEIEKQAKIKGLINLTPALGEPGVPLIKLLLGKLLSRIYPRFSLNTGIDLSLASRDPEVVKVYAQDPLRHTMGTARLSTEFFRTLAWVKEHASELDVPFLMVIAGGDKVTFPEDSRAFFQQLNLSDKELQEYPESYHCIQDDLNYKEVLDNLADWLERHI
ncbi:alpha/beta hydrolase [Calothrix sp. UHCC 0171]|uniref:alpha/beta hydrolase n=1 Tax=Calothrix sp. UHCC 0171 TaxID=3110245 RepID=UPI002B220502|nr:alpha/beta hydrolase [Calothrix sp. UHCC 0171]MEA5570749.1 lysophospholipase [Calothrix sp. UHCC 0171]